MAKGRKAPPNSVPTAATDEHELVMTVLAGLSASTEGGTQGFDDWWLALGLSVQSDAIWEIEKRVREELLRLGLKEHGNSI